MLGCRHRYPFSTVSALEIASRCDLQVLLAVLLMQQELAAQVAKLRGEAGRASRDRAGMEEVYLSFKKGVEGETEFLKARFDELQARVIEADARRDQAREEKGRQKG